MVAFFFCPQDYPQDYRFVSLFGRGWLPGQLPPKFANHLARDGLCGLRLLYGCRDQARIHSIEILSHRIGEPVAVDVKSCRFLI